MNELNETPDTNPEGAEQTRPAECSTNTTQMPIYDEHAQDDAGAAPAADAGADAKAIEVLESPAASADYEADDETESIAGRMSDFEDVHTESLDEDPASNGDDNDDAAQGDAGKFASPAAQPRVQDASASVPLYATEPPRGFGYPQHGANPQAAGSSQSPHHGQPYVQVPREPHPVAPLLRKTGPSVPTIILGTLGLVLGAVVAAFGWFFPMDVIMNPVVNIRVFIAALFAILGGILIVVALMWALASWLRRGNAQDPAKASERE